MDFPHLSSIANRRKRLRLTQQELAKLCDIGQSFLAKVERGRAMPSYEIAVRLFTELDRHESTAVEGQVGQTAEDIMARKVITVTSKDSAKYARKIMLDKNISQLPVVDGKNGAPEGVVSEKSLLGKELEGKTVRELMDKEALPMVAKGTKGSVIISILREQEQQAVLVVEKGKIAGIITKYDIIAKAIKSRPSM